MVNFQLSLLRQEAEELRLQKLEEQKEAEERQAQRKEGEGSEEYSKSKRRSSTQLSGQSPLQLIAKELNLSVDEVRTAKKFFDQFDIDGDGFLGKAEFRQLVAAISGVENPEDIEEETLNTKWVEADKDGSECVDFWEFATWYSAHGFLEDLLLSPEQRHIREVARKYDVEFVEVENVKRMFDKFDEDGGGLLEFGEFKILLYRLMKIPAHLEMPSSRVKQFWAEIDLDGSGNVDFEEFLQWYMRSFDLAGGGQLVSPIEHFYKSV